MMYDLIIKQGKIVDGTGATGYIADLVIFDYATIKDNSWFGNVEAANDGIHYVIVNGVIAVEEGKVTGALAGRAVR